jgi:hypothetical protein
VFRVSVDGAAIWNDSLLFGAPTPIRCLQALDVHDNDHTHVAVREISDPLLDLPLKVTTQHPYGSIDIKPLRPSVVGQRGRPAKTGNLVLYCGRTTGI